MYALLGVLPILCAIVLMLGFNQKASISMFLAWLMTSVVAFIFWHLHLDHLLTYTLFGFLSAVDVLFIIFSAIFLLNTLKHLGFLATISRGFDGITQDRRIQILIISWAFGALMEGAAGFGTPAALAAPLLVSLGVPTFFAALASLMANPPANLFGAVGTPTTVGFSSISAGLAQVMGSDTTALLFRQMNSRIALMNFLPATLMPFVIICFVVAHDGRKEGLKNAINILPFALFSGLAFSVPALLMALLGPELPTLVGSLMALLLIILATKLGFLVPKRVYRFMDDPLMPPTSLDEVGTPLWVAWSPYALIATLLIISRVPQFHVSALLSSERVTVTLVNLFGFDNITWRWAFLKNPGVFPFLPTALLFLVIRKTSPRVITSLTKDTLIQLKHASIALVFGFAMVQLMRFTDYSLLRLDSPPLLGPMTTEMASVLARFAGGFYPLISPLIGVLGAFVSGSSTVSNVMFFGLQADTAQLLGLPVGLVLSAQAIGGSIGSMLSINNVIAVCVTTRAEGSENKLIKGAILPALFYSGLISLTMYFILYIGVLWIL